MTAASTPPSPTRPTASSVVNAVTCRCAKLLGRPLPQTWIWASTIGITYSPLMVCRPRQEPSLRGGFCVSHRRAILHDQSVSPHAGLHGALSACVTRGCGYTVVEARLQ